MRALALTSVRRDFRQLGLSRACFVVAHKAMERIFSVKILIWLEISPAWINPKLFSDETGFGCRFLSAHEVESFARNPANQMPEGFVRRALAQGSECFAVLDRENLASFGWYSSQPTPVMGEFKITFNERYTYMYHGYTKPEYRGMRLHGIGKAHALREYAARGQTGIFGYSERSNLRALRSLSRAGFRRVGWTLRMRVGRKLFFLQSRRPMQWQIEPIPTIRMARRGGSTGRRHHPDR